MQPRLEVPRDSRKDEQKRRIRLQPTSAISAASWACACFVSVWTIPVNAGFEETALWKTRELFEAWKAAEHEVIHPPEEVLGAGDTWVARDVTDIHTLGRDMGRIGHHLGQSNVSLELWSPDTSGVSTGTDLAALAAKAKGFLQKGAETYGLGIAVIHGSVPEIKVQSGPLAKTGKVNATQALVLADWHHPWKETRTETLPKAIADMKHMIDGVLSHIKSRPTGLPAAAMHRRNGRLYFQSSVHTRPEPSSYTGRGTFPFQFHIGRIVGAQ